MRFEQDVRRAIRLGLVKLVVRYDDDGAIDLDEDGIPDEVEEVAVVLWEHYDFICSLFTSYAILNSNLSFLTLDSWSALVKDCKFTSAHTRYSKHSPVFIASDHTKEDMLERTDPVNATALATLVDDGPLTDEGSMEIEHKMSEVPTGAPSAEELRRRVEELQDAVDAVAVMKLAEMREALASRDLDTSGKKATLAERLVATLLADLAAAEVEAASHEESESERKNKYAAMVAGVVSKASLTKAKASRWRRASSERTIGRADLMIRLISIAIRKYVVTGKIYDVSEAVEKLLHVDMLLRLGVGRFPDPDAVRRSFCYTPSMCMVLERYEPTLRRIFDAVAQGKPTMPLDSWLSFLGVMQFIGKDVSAHDAARSFAWSRMVVVHGSSSKGAIKENQLPFEGFVEALIRVSILKALPTLEDIDEDGSVDVVEYMGRMTPGQMVHSEFLELRAAPWGEPPKLPHVDLRIEMLVRLAVNRIRLVLKARSSGQLETARVSKWRKVGRKKPTAGGEIVNKALASGLCAKLRFTRAELDRFKVPQELKAGTFIQVGSEYFAYVGLIEPFRQLSEQEVQEWHISKAR
ncbi:flagellar associated protein [Chrysochromulina tobinii]|uniref:Flagellar associated protein n=1 Tax=Chrysochromulina tobinii TaxID=1460289 RepID=A0A0M0J644_9EUKA|nr:flagellar associated protein [Chrysochromulina tobinii]|eukprot:KOO21693.1 flagellar associated protein [Chrysochromulina sp. CCMP291]